METVLSVYNSVARVVGGAKCGADILWPSIIKALILPSQIGIFFLTLAMRVCGKWYFSFFRRNQLKIVKGKLIAV